MIYISSADNERLSNSQLVTNDIILSKVGNSIGYFARVDEAIGRCNISENNIGIKLQNYDDITKHYILTFLNTSIANKLVLRRKSGNAQPKLNVNDLTYIPILEASHSLEKAVSNLILLSSSVVKKSGDTFQEALDLLIQELNMKSLHNSFMGYTSKYSYLQQKNRFDAEYYHPTYLEYEHLIKAYPEGFADIGDICNIKDGMFDVDNNSLYKYIELADIGKNGDIQNCITGRGNELPTRARRLIQKDDVIVSSIEGSLESCAIVTSDYDSALCSTGFYVINSDSFTPETLLVLFKSLPIQRLMKRGCTGTILTAISKHEFSTIPLPLIRNVVQLEISNLVQKSFKLKEESNRLLDIAKRAVEIDFVENEECALNYLRENGNG